MPPGWIQENDRKVKVNKTKELLEDGYDVQLLMRPKSGQARDMEVRAGQALLSRWSLAGCKCG
jgi:hypothetical protein